MDIPGSFLPFSIRAKIAQFQPRGFGSWDDAFRGSPGGSYGRAVPAVWTPRAGLSQDVILKLMIGQTPDGGGGETSRDGFDNEVDVLQQVRVRFDATRAARAATDVPAHIAGLAHLTFTFCTGWEESAASILPSQAPLGAPLFFIAMEPLAGGTLWNRLRSADGPLPHDDALRAAADLLAALAALHALGFAHADLKLVWGGCCRTPYRSCPSPLPTQPPSLSDQGRQHPFRCARPWQPP